MAANTFTTYVNAKRTGSVDSEFAALEQRATKSLSGIQQKAEAATRALGGIGRGGGRVASPLPASFSQDLDRAAARVDRLRMSEERLARENGRLVQSLRTTGQTLGIVQGPLGPIAGRVNAAADAFARLTGVSLGLAGAGAAVFAYASAANRFVEIRSKLAPLFESQEQVNGALDKVAGIALRARSGLEPVVDLYAKLKLGADQFGISQERAMRITEIASKAATLSGGSSQSREAGLYQFAQGFGSGNLSGDELKSVRENTLFLSRALSEGLGKLPDFKGVDTSIGKLKELGAEGKLTADVIARALEASAGSVEAAFAKLPPTLSSAFTSLQTNATMFIGRLEQSTGIVGGLASGLLIVGNNLNGVISILGGMAAAWAAVGIAAKASDASQYLSGYIRAAQFQKDSAKTAVDNATAQKRAITQNTLSMEIQGMQIRENIVALERQLAVERQIAAQATTSAQIAPFGPGRREAKVANANVAATSGKLVNEIEKLSTVQTQAATSARNLEGANKALGVATSNLAKQKSLLRSVAGSLLGAINPLGIAVAIATTAFLAWAQAESEAEKNARKVEDAQRKLATVIDATTGKIIEQNAALLANARLETGEAANTATQEYGRQRGEIAALASRFRAQRAGGGANAVYVNQSLTGTQTQAKSLLENYGRGNGTEANLIAALDALAKADPSLRALRDEVTRLGAGAVNSAKQSAQLRASLGIMAGATDAETRRRAAGDFSRGRSADQANSGKTEAQIAADIEALRARLRDKRFAAETQMTEALARLNDRRGKMSAADYTREAAQIKATYDSAVAGIDRQDAAAGRRAEREEERKRKAHERELARIERENEARERRTEKRSDIMQQYDEAPRPVIKARDQIDDLNRMIGDTLNGIAEVTDKNPLGQGLYTEDMAKADAERIREGLQRPYNEYMDARQRDANLQGLILEGREAEAEALRRAYDLHEQGASITQDQYESILAGVRAEEQINDLLEQRERLIAPLRASVGELRGSIASAIEDLMSGGNPLTGAKNLLKGIMSNFNRATAAQIAEKITGGLDQRVRDMISGSVKVDSKIADYIAALDDGGTASDRLATALDGAAEAANSAAAALQGVGAAGGGAGGGAAGLVGASSTAAIGSVLQAMAGASGAIPASFYKPGVKVGSGQGDNVLFKALGQFGGVITENLRSQSRQNDYFRRGLTEAEVSDHTTTQEAYDVRLPSGMSFQKATALIRKTASEMGVSVVKAIDETVSGGTGRHGHYVFGAGRSAGRQVEQATSGIGGTLGGMPVSIISQAISGVVKFGKSLTRGGKTAVAGDDVDVVVSGPRPGTGGRGQPTQGGRAPTLEQVYNMEGRAIGDKLDSVFGSKFFGKLGGQLGTALKGAQTGVMVSGIAKSLGLKQSKTGAAIGGGIGGVAGTALGGPVGGKIGAALGGLIGGTIGGRLKENKFNFKAAALGTLLLGPLGGLLAGTAFAKAKKGTVTLGAANGEVSVGKATGNAGSYRKAATELGGSAGAAISQIAEQLDATIGGFAVSIGKRKGNFVVDSSGKGRTKGAGVQKFKDEEEAVRAALTDAIRDGAIAGISAASRALLTSGKAIEGQIRKAQILESIPKRLMAIKDPVRFAVSELNREFAEMIRYLQEGGASAAQFGEAQELYDLERARAIEQATQQSVSAIQDYLDGMLGGSQSPLNRLTVYQNAQSQLAGLATDVQAGKAVDNDKLLAAVDRFQEASRALNGSNESFFADFNYLVGLLGTAKQNVVSATAAGGDLPGSPFSDAQIQSIINGSNGTTVAINYQTQQLSGLLGGIISRMDSGAGRNGFFSAIDALPSSGGRFDVAPFANDFAVK